MNFQDFISASVIIEYLLPIILYVYTEQSYHKIAFIGTFVTMVISECIKHYFVKKASPRPRGAINCNLLCTDGNQEGKPGMPSSHAATVTFFAAFYFRHTSNFYLRALLILYAILVISSRYVKRCHSIPQLAGGALLGYLLSVLLNG